MFGGKSSLLSFWLQYEGYAFKNEPWTLKSNVDFLFKSLKLSLSTDDLSHSHYLTESQPWTCWWYPSHLILKRYVRICSKSSALTILLNHSLLSSHCKLLRCFSKEMLEQCFYSNITYYIQVCITANDVNGKDENDLFGFQIQYHSIVRTSYGLAVFYYYRMIKSLLLLKFCSPFSSFETMYGIKSLCSCYSFTSQYDWLHFLYCVQRAKASD